MMSWSTRLMIVMGLDLSVPGEGCPHGAMINMLPNEVLVEIFDSCRINESGLKPWKWKWIRLVHVCRRWRQIIFASPNCLNLQLLCTDGTPVTKKLGCWPDFPIALEYVNFNMVTPNDQVHIVTLLRQQPDRLRRLDLPLAYERARKMVIAMEKPVPALTNLILRIKDVGFNIILPDWFLGGFAPLLQEIIIQGIAFPALPKLLSSAQDLVSLEHFEIPETGYISPEAIVMGLAAATRLQHLHIGLLYPFPLLSESESTPLIPYLPPVARTVFPALASLRLMGSREYLEDFVTQVDCPRLKWIAMSYLEPPDGVYFRVPQLFGLIGRSEILRLALAKRVDVYFAISHITLNVNHDHDPPSQPSPITIEIDYSGLFQQVLHTVQFLRQFSVSHVEYLQMHWNGFDDSQTEIGIGDWLEFLHPFTAVKAMRVSEKLVGYLALALENINAEMEILPALELLCLEGLSLSIDKFVSARQISGHPITVVRTLREFYDSNLPY